MLNVKRAQFGFAAALAVIPAILATACSATSQSSDEGETATVSQPIIGGSAATAYPEAILIDIYQGTSLYAYCSGSVIAPQVVMTAGHCVDGFSSWKITAPNASGQKASSTSGTTYDWKENGSETVDPSHHDIGLIFLSTPINLSSYPVLATSPLADGSSITNIGRIDNGTLSTTNLYVSKPTTITGGTAAGFPYDYSATDIIQSGDSGGPDEVPGSSPHEIVSVNSGAGGSSEVLARVDLLSSWISGEIASHGGAGSSSGGGGSGGTTADAGTDSGSSSGSGGSGGSGGGSGSGGSGGSASTCTGGGADYQHPVALAASDCGNLAASQVGWYSFTVSKGEDYDIALTPTGDGELELWHQSTSGYTQVANTTATSIAHSSTNGGAYILAVFSPSGAAQSYTATYSN